MGSPEFQQQLNKARNFSRVESDILRTDRRSGLFPVAQEYLGVLKEDPEYRQARRMILLDRWEAFGRSLPEFTEEQWKETGQVLSGLNNGVKAGLFLEIARNASPGTYMPLDTVVERFRNLFQGTEPFGCIE